MKNLENFNKEISKELGVEEKIALAANKFYWKTFASSMLKLEHNSYFIRGFGNFDRSKYKLYSEISEIIKAIRRAIASPKYTEETREKIIKNLKNKLSLLLSKRHEVMKIYNGYTKRVLGERKTGLEKP